MGIFDGANLVEFEVGGGGLMSVAKKKKNTKKFGWLLKLHISGTTGLIPFKFDM